jgi:hypothetical protein
MPPDLIVETKVHAASDGFGWPGWAREQAPTLGLCFAIALYAALTLRFLLRHERCGRREPEPRPRTIRFFTAARRPFWRLDALPVRVKTANNGAEWRARRNLL